MAGRKKGFIPKNKTVWPNGAEAYIKENFHSMTNVAMAKHLNVGLTVFRDKCRKMGLKHIEMEYWNNDQIAFLHANYQLMGDTEMALIFNEVCPKNKPWTKKHIEKKRRYLKLDRTSYQVQAINHRNVNIGFYAECAVKRWKVSTQAAINEVRIWKHNYKGLNSQFKVIKTANGFVHYAPWLYAQHFGKMPKDHVVGFKDRDNLNVVAENLEAITRAEHARRNSVKYSDEMRDFIKLLKQLNKTISQKIKNQK